MTERRRNPLACLTRALTLLSLVALGGSLLGALACEKDDSGASTISPTNQSDRNTGPRPGTDDDVTTRTPGSPKVTPKPTSPRSTPGDNSGVSTIGPSTLNGLSEEEKRVLARQQDVRKMLEERRKTRGALGDRRRELTP